MLRDAAVLPVRVKVKTRLVGPSSGTEAGETARVITGRARVSSLVIVPVAEAKVLPTGEGLGLPTGEGLGLPTSEGLGLPTM